MQWISTGRLIEGATQGLAVDGDVLSDLMAHVIQPALNTSNESGRIEPREHSAKRVMRGDTVCQEQESPQPCESLPTEAFDVYPSIRTGNGPAKGDDDQIEQLVTASSLDTRIGKIFKRCKNCSQPLGHEKTSMKKVFLGGIHSTALDSFNPPQILPTMRCDCRGPVGSFHTGGSHMIFSWLVSPCC